MACCDSEYVHRYCKVGGVVTQCSNKRQQPTDESRAAGSVLQQITSTPRSKTSAAALNRLSKPELQQELRLRGLSDQGKKPELKQRLLDAFEPETPAAGLHAHALWTDKAA